MDDFRGFRGESKWKDCCRDDLNSDRYSGTLRDGGFGRSFGGEGFGRTEPSFGNRPRFER